MNQYLKVFLVSLLIFSFVVFTGFYSYSIIFNPYGFDDLDEDYAYGDEEDEEDIKGTPLERAIKKSNRVNVLLVGLQGTLTDTIMIASFDRRSKELDIISVPRDTYYPREIARSGQNAKINAVFGTDEGRHEALLEAVVDLTKIPIEHYVLVDYDGVKKAVEALGGVEVDVPFHMKYTDRFAHPPLYINILPGRKVLDGDDAIGFLRFRQGDPGYPGYPGGDLDRVKTQQEFIKAAVKKSLSLRLPSVINSVYPYVKTNFTLTELLGLGGDAVGFSTANIKSSTLPGVPEYIGKLSFYIPDNEAIIENLYDLYNVPLKPEVEDTGETEEINKEQEQ